MPPTQYNDTFALAYGSITLVGGIIGYLKANSYASSSHHLKANADWFQVVSLVERYSMLWRSWRVLLRRGWCFLLDLCFLRFSLWGFCRVIRLCLREWWVRWGIIKRLPADVVRMRCINMDNIWISRSLGIKRTEIGSTKFHLRMTGLKIHDCCHFALNVVRFAARLFMFLKNSCESFEAPASLWMFLPLGYSGRTSHLTLISHCWPRISYENLVFWDMTYTRLSIQVDMNLQGIPFQGPKRPPAEIGTTAATRPTLPKKGSRSRCGEIFEWWSYVRWRCCFMY